MSVDFLDNETLKANVFSPAERVKILELKASIQDRLLDLGAVEYPFLHNSPFMFLAGGCFTSIFHNGEPKDYDFYIMAGNNAVENLVVEDLKFRILNKAFPNATVTTSIYAAKNPMIKEVWTDPTTKTQFMFTNYTSRLEIINDFDFVHCKASFQSHNLYITREIYDAINNKQLVVNNPNNVTQSRIIKFVQTRGFLPPKKKLIDELDMAPWTT